MDTKEDYLIIVKGPSEHDLYMNFMLWEELTDGKIKRELTFSLENGWEMRVSRISLLQHEDGSGTSFNIEADLEFYDRFAILRHCFRNAPFYYSAKSRKGVVSGKAIKSCEVWFDEAVSTFSAI